MACFKPKVNTALTPASVKVFSPPLPEGEGVLLKALEKYLLPLGEGEYL